MIEPSAKIAPGTAAAIPSPLWRLGALLPLLAALLLVPPPDRELPAWAVLLPLIAASRALVLRERLGGLADLEASLPFLALGPAALFRFAPSQAAAASLEVLATLLLLALLGSFARRSRGESRWALTALELPAIGILAFAWALLPPLTTAALTLVLVLALATAPRRRRQP